MKYTVLTMVILSVTLCVLRHHITWWFFSDAEMNKLFSEMLFYYSLFMMTDTLLPIFGTLLRTFDMNTESTMIIFVLFGIPFLVQTYVYAVCLGLEELSALLAFFFSNVVASGVYILFLVKYTRRNLEAIIERVSTGSSQKIELLIKD